MSFISWLPVSFLVAVGAGAAITAVLLRIARRAQIMDVPNDRSSHTVPTPRGGGLTMVLGATIAGLIVLVLEVFGTPGTGAVLAWLLGGLFLAGFSLVDDLRPLPAGVRLGLQSLVVGVILFFAHGWPVLNLPGLPAIAWGPFGYGLLFFWVVGLSNVYNFMDGIDGIAGIQALAAAMGWLGLGLLWNDALLLWVGLALAGSTLGFLFFNWSPAKIFMGDVGSAYLGFTFALLPILVHARHPNVELTTLLGCAVIFVWPFLFDGGYTILHRIRRRENLMKAHRSHLYQRLVIAGCGHAPVSFTYGLLALCGAPLAFLWAIEHPSALWWTLGVLLPLAIGLALVTKRIESRARSQASATAEAL